MANIASQKKRNRQNETRRVRNLGVRSELKTRTKNVHSAIEAGDQEATAAAIVRAQKRLGKATTKGVLHKNAAARRTSRLMKAANRAQQG